MYKLIYLPFIIYFLFIECPAFSREPMQLGGASFTQTTEPSEEYVLQIASYLTAEQILQMAHTNKKLKHLIDSAENDYELNFSGRTLSNEDFLTLFGKDGVFSKAKKLNLSSSQFNHKLLSKLPKSITSLKISKIGLSCEGLKHLAKLSKLETLDLSLNPIGSEGQETLNETVHPIHRLLNLESLDLSQTKLTEAEKEDLKNKLPNAKIIF